MKNFKTARTATLGVLSAIGIFAAACKGEKKHATKLSTEIDSVSYALGIDIAGNLKQSFPEYEKDLFLQGFSESIDSTKKILIAKEKVNEILAKYFNRVRKEKQEKEAMEKYGDYKKECEKFLEENKNKENVKVTESGLQYIVMTEGTGATPKAEDTVTVHYHGTDIKGEVFDSSVERKKPASFGVSQVIPGWTEGLQLMKEGAKYKFFIPQELAYGSRPAGKIKPFSTLIFEVELIKINKPENK